jgi:Flp pilus assembly protein TadG
MNVSVETPSFQPAGRAPALARCAARAGSESGQAMVEMTLVILPLLLLTFGMASFGLALNSWIDETHLSSAAARFLAVNQKPGGESVPAWVKTHGDNANVKQKATVTVCSPGSQVGEYVEVKLTYPQPLLQILGLGPNVNVTSTAQMRIEIPPASPYPTAC